MRPDPASARSRMLRQVTTERLVRAHREAVPVTIATHARVDALFTGNAARDRPTLRPSTTALLAFRLVQALVAQPEMNAHLDGDAVVARHAVNLGVAVSRTDGELGLPVVAHAQKLTCDELDAVLQPMITRARDGRSRRDDTHTSPSFLLSNVGRGLAPLTGTPSLVPGVTGVLLTSGRYPAPVVNGDAVVIGQLIDISLTVDHRVVNGVPAARFLRTFADSLEMPLR